MIYHAKKSHLFELILSTSKQRDFWAYFKLTMRAKSLQIKKLANFYITRVATFA